MATVPASAFVSVTPAVLAAAGTALSFSFKVLSPTTKKEVQQLYSCSWLRSAELRIDVCFVRREWEWEAWN